MNYKVLFMYLDEQQQAIGEIEDIKHMMQKSSRFISLSGWSGICAGVCALAAAAYTLVKIESWKRQQYGLITYGTDYSDLRFNLLSIAAVTFSVAFILAFLFTYLRSRKTGVPVWGYVARKVMINVAVPMIAGALLIYKMMEHGFYGLVAPACLIFYGISLINASKYTLPEIRYLGFGQMLLGVINLWMVGYGLYFWAAGFGVLHIIYGIIMWNKYERKD